MLKEIVIFALVLLAICQAVPLSPEEEKKPETQPAVEETAKAAGSDDLDSSESRWGYGGGRWGKGWGYGGGWRRPGWGYGSGWRGYGGGYGYGGGWGYGGGYGGYWG